MPGNRQRAIDGDPAMAANDTSRGRLPRPDLPLISTTRFLAAHYAPTVSAANDNHAPVAGDHT